MQETASQPASLRRLLRFNRTSYALLSGFVLIVGLILYVWQPLVREYLALFNPIHPALAAGGLAADRHFCLHDADHHGRGGPAPGCPRRCWWG